MKNLNMLTDRADIRGYIQGLWRTKMFQTSPYVAEIVDQVADAGPIAFFDMDEPAVEWSQFTTWMGAIALRHDYDNDAIHDLYYLHEFIHFATMTYDPNLSFVAWHRKMCENEMLASTHSECFAYFQIPELRERSFEFEIWVDRYLEDPETLTKIGPWRGMAFGPFSDEDKILSALLDHRKRVMTTPDPFDFTEMQIHYYGMQNMQWSNVWKDSRREVEEAMAEVRNLSDTGFRTRAGRVLQSWLESVRNRESNAGPAPYWREAERFAEVVRSNKKRQGNEILRK